MLRRVILHVILIIGALLLALIVHETAASLFRFYTEHRIVLPRITRVALFARDTVFPVCLLLGIAGCGTLLAGILKRTDYLVTAILLNAASVFLNSFLLLFIAIPFFSKVGLPL